MRRMVLVLLAVALPGLGAAQGKTLVLAADSRLEASGLLAYLTPRFGLKYGIRASVIAGDDAELRDLAAGADAILATEAQAQALRAEGLGEALRPVFNAEDDGTYALVLVPGADNADNARRFSDWLVSEVGQRTLTSFDGPVAYAPGSGEVVAEEVYLPKGDTDEGMKLSKFHCGRCHIVDERNRFGGIGSTPSFAAMRSLDDWERKFRNFWAEPPHPSFTQVEGVTEPFDPMRPPHIAPVEMTLDDLAAIVAFAASVEPKDLGAPVNSR